MGHRDGLGSIELEIKPSRDNKVGVRAISPHQVRKIIAVSLHRLQDGRGEQLLRCGSPRKEIDLESGFSRLPSGSKDVTEHVVAVAVVHEAREGVRHSS